MVQFLFCKKGEPTVLFSLIGALLPTDFVSWKSKTTFFYSNLNLKKEKKEKKRKRWENSCGRRDWGKARKSTCFECKKLPKNFWEEMALISSQLWVICSSMCLLKVWPSSHDYHPLFTYLNNKKKGHAKVPFALQYSKVSWDLLPHYIPSITLCGGDFSSVTLSSSQFFKLVGNVLFSFNFHTYEMFKIWEYTTLFTNSTIKGCCVVFLTFFKVCSVSI